MISTIILSAGLSERFGSPKALAKITPDTTVIHHILKTYLHSNIDEIIIVLGAHHSQIRPQITTHPKIKICYNKNYKQGQTSSFKCALKYTHQHSKAVFLHPIDYPNISSQTINFLLDQFHQYQPKILIPTFDNLKGHPPLFHSSIYNDFQNVSNNLGLNTIAKKYQDNQKTISVTDSGVRETFNTINEFAMIQKIMQSRRTT